ncbi:MAG: bifunctional UDP-3-O-[3-hydroxymyristoyl] N-acetylglucosamine deacetylase/3-hydroxyacyl-ACP dehydratase [Candidatus Thermochlorobacter aerophilum]|jgi:UDP-3-O-[3-hydroxymyristoyl] N-acetylglucosamine deacetylase/3-hydroxyacyl-[acyl-carrier-protein] dehydratase|uniref:Multifunctional fusion protein n=1 Tax=Candidatus Thermochlorobacter aerophilus TaxID=1868324 RepID=A0A395LXV8_9BACT|nr:MAG: bifunctional UDP-3-O-[3-hydroxymyristoyl] N-acetylglucosamine deacetylase/3-hydroxyacyl-ACP dehydratase [Candidatus Thermochlorobacter aerophilum]
MLAYQRTIKKEVSIWGRGLHTGQDCMITFKPAPEDYGYRFVRTDLPDSPEIPADIDHVIDIRRGTTIGIGDAKVHTTEHVLAALYGLQIDNCRIELTGPEPPVLDGSSKPFVDALLSAGFETQSAPKNYLVIEETVEYVDEARGVHIVGLPLDDFRATIMIDYKNPALGSQHTGIFDMEKEFASEFAGARTFCFLSEVAELARQGLIRGGDINNAIVIADCAMSQSELDELAQTLSGGKNNLRLEIGANGILNNRELRYPNEPARHKLLDLLGDLALIGMPIKAQILAARPGHAANVEFVKKLKKLIEKNKLTRRYQHERKAGVVFDAAAIQRILPHRYPFLLIDKILEFKLDEKIVAVKNVTLNEPFFQGHFPGNPIMPGVLILEAMAQSGGILLLNGNESFQDKDVFFMGIDHARFRKPVVPGDTLIIESVVKNRRRNVCRFSSQAFVRGELVCEAELMATVVPRQRSTSGYGAL